MFSQSKQQHIFGRPSKHRYQQPNMFQLLSWPQPLIIPLKMNSQPQLLTPNHTIQKQNQQNLSSSQNKFKKQNLPKQSFQNSPNYLWKKLIKQKIQKFKQNTRQLPNSSFTTFFGKLPFENYGSANIKPSVGGIVYGQYLFTHNINSQNNQIYPQALNIVKNRQSISKSLPKKYFTQDKRSPKVLQKIIQASKNVITKSQIKPLIGQIKQQEQKQNSIIQLNKNIQNKRKKYILNSLNR